MEERIERERMENLFKLVKNLMKNMQFSAEQAMTAMGISEEDKEKIRKKM